MVIDTIAYVTRVEQEEPPEEDRLGDPLLPTVAGGKVVVTAQCAEGFIQFLSQNANSRFTNDSSVMTHYINNLQTPDRELPPSQRRVRINPVGLFRRSEERNPAWVGFGHVSSIGFVTGSLHLADGTGQVKGLNDRTQASIFLPNGVSDSPT